MNYNNINNKPLLFMLLATVLIECVFSAWWSPTPRPTRPPTAPGTVVDYASEDMDYGFFKPIVEKVISYETVKSMACLNEGAMWNTVSAFGQHPSFLDHITEITSKDSVYNELKTYISTFPIYYDDDMCAVDHFIKKKVPSLTPNIELISNGVDIENKLSPIYSQLKPYIDSFASLLSAESKNTTMAVTYTYDLCLDIGLEFCYKYGFGFAFNFNDGVIYYKTGVQGLTLGATDDKSLLPGSLSFSVAYDVLGKISYVPGTLYSLDIGISTGMVTKLIAMLGENIFDNFKSQYGFSYLIGVNSLQFHDLFDDDTKCIGFSFGRTLSSIAGGLIPGVSFGISRAATVKTSNITYTQKLIQKGENVDFDDNDCISEQLFSTIGCCGFEGLRPDIDL